MNTANDANARTAETAAEIAAKPPGNAPFGQKPYMGERTREAIMAAEV